ncbi:hypothetical protein [Campylobacter ureolyticus]|nr:hypothetical protein [Campylobacter ureolyticus]MCZ6150893.1 hypothetical protein [Campylobacter ureolyticus]MCZ6173136.1 hypothetical protein [Campylobacter ureolyticus]
MKDENKKYFLLRKNTENYEHPDDFVEKFKEKKLIVGIFLKKLVKTI